MSDDGTTAKWDHRNEKYQPEAPSEVWLGYKDGMWINMQWQDHGTVPYIRKDRAVAEVIAQDEQVPFLPARTRDALKLILAQRGER